MIKIGNKETTSSSKNPEKPGVEKTKSETCCDLKKLKENIDGKKKTEQENQTENPEKHSDSFDRKGKPEFRRYEKTDERVLLTENGQEFGSQAREKLSDKEYIKRFKEIVKSPDQWFVFEEQILFYHDTNRLKHDFSSVKLRKSLREYGKELLGIDKIEARIKQKYNIKIETDSWEEAGHSDVFNQLLSLRSVESQLNQLEAGLAKYPMTFIQASGLKLIYLLGGWGEKTGKGKELKRISTGGYAFGDGKIGFSNVRLAFDHELLHCADYTDGGRLGDDNLLWGWTAHGEEYGKLYGKSGRKAIESGKAFGPRPEGFAEAYGRWGGIDEDQATVAEIMLRDGRDIEVWAKNEPELAEKIEMTKIFYYRLSGGKMDEKYWKYLRNWQDKERNNPSSSEEKRKFWKNYWEKREFAQDYQKNSKWDRKIEEAFRKNFENNELIEALIIPLADFGFEIIGSQKEIKEIASFIKTQKQLEFAVAIIWEKIQEVKKRQQNSKYSAEEMANNFFSELKKHLPAALDLEAAIRKIKK